jgi:hypothetical protein
MFYLYHWIKLSKQGDTAIPMSKLCMMPGHTIKRLGSEHAGNARIS